MKTEKLKGDGGAKSIVKKMSTKELAEAIGQNAEVEFRKSMMREISGNREGLHVSDLVGECMRRTALSKMYEEANKAKGLSPPMRAEGVGAIYVGKIIHAHSNLDGIGNEMPLCFDIEKKKPVAFDPKTKSFDLPKGWEKRMYDFIFGSCDDLLDDPLVGTVIVDKKTMDLKGFVPKKAYDHHVDQINYYRYLLAKCKNIDAKWGVSLYIDLDKRTSTIFKFAYPLSSVEAIEKEILEKRQLLLDWQSTGELPPRVIHYACVGYCSVYSECFRRND